MKRWLVMFVGNEKEMKDWIIKKQYKSWNKAACMWEEKMILFSFIPFYKYSVRVGAKLNVSYTLLRKKGKLMNKPNVTKIYIGKQEIKEKYKGNVWAAPTNLTIEQ